MKQYRITTNNIPQNDDSDCFMSPDDPMYALKARSFLDSDIDISYLIDEYNKTPLPTIVCSSKGELEKTMNIKPGTKEWFTLWFGK